MSKVVLISAFLVAIAAVAFSTDFTLEISEVYSNANPDLIGSRFVEFYNPLTYDVDITGWRLEILQTDGTIATIPITASAVIRSYGFFLVGIGSKSEAWNPAWPTPDVMSLDTNFPAINIGVRLVDGEGYVSDALGWGVVSDNRFYEEVPQVNPNMGSSIERKSGVIHNEYQGNSYDTGNNYNDTYVRPEPQPQNTSSPIEDPSANVQDYSIGVLKAFYGE
jgi:hypothetical protein